MAQATVVSKTTIGFMGFWAQEYSRFEASPSTGVSPEASPCRKPLAADRACCRLPCRHKCAAQCEADTIGLGWTLGELHVTLMAGRAMGGQYGQYTMWWSPSTTPPQQRQLVWWAGGAETHVRPDLSLMHPPADNLCEWPRAQQQPRVRAMVSPSLLALGVNTDRRVFVCSGRGTVASVQRPASTRTHAPP